jgi:GR25 family glycosyltransferase involved in LPS biosynthesis
LLVFGGRHIAKLYTRHQSSGAYIVSRAGAARYLELTANASLPADYSLFPSNPRRMGLRIYQLCPAIAIQDHLVPREEGGQTFATAMAGNERRNEADRSSSLQKIGREGGRLIGQFAGLMEWTYQKTVLRLETTRVSVG